jgi:hypothetical protein
LKYLIHLYAPYLLVFISQEAKAIEDHNQAAGLVDQKPWNHADPAS